MTDHDTPRTPGEPTPVRIGDAERQRMTDLLQQHMASGRLDMAEYERRVEHATSAIYEQDLAGLLDDLPPLDEDGEPVGRTRAAGPARAGGDRGWDQPSWWPPRPTGRGRPPWGRGVPFPLLAFGMVALVVVTHGWILLPLAFLAFSRGGWCGPGRDAGRYQEHGRRHESTGERARTSGGRDDRPQWPGRFDPFDEDRRV